MRGFALVAVLLQAVPTPNATPPAVISSDDPALAAREPATEAALEAMADRYLATTFNVRVASGIVICHPSAQFGSAKLGAETCIAARSCIGEADIAACVEAKKQELLNAYRKAWRGSHR